MTNNQLTRERLEKIKSWRETYGAGSNVMLPAEEAEELARMALTAMDSEPVGWRWRWSDDAEGYWRYTEEQRETRGSVTAQPLYRHAQQPVVPEEKPMPNTLSMYAVDAVAAIAEVKGWNACRAAMLNHPSSIQPNTDAAPGSEIKHPSSNSPVIPEGYVMVPMRLTAENGAKAALLGEFNLEYTLTCHECFGEGCDDCSGEGTWTSTMPIDWTTIKEIWDKAINHFAAAQREVKSE
ncbi:hypothetical protein [Klebsiella michiganensis]|uniref:hypothetical protein n=1 Tax=Klebsiella michiganensis TaxID=1134687 RepID=UPI00211461E1|nr:hypothetical protein [Klebsiella michiganensis]